MIVLNELNRPYVIDSLTQPLVLRHHWAFDAHMMDFCLKEIQHLEETMGPTISLMIADCLVEVPGSWNIVIVDYETYTVDAIPVTACAAFDHRALVFSPNDSKLISEPVRVVQWNPKSTSVYPAVEKATGIVHAITPGLSHGEMIPRGVLLSPHDLYRWIGGKTVGDLLG